MAKKQYTTDPKEIYSLELQKLQRSFSELHQVGEELSEVSRVGWRHVEHLRHVNFILKEAVQTGEALLKIAG
jgi:hypothetical protein